MKKLLNLALVLAFASGTALFLSGCSSTEKKEDEAVKQDGAKPELKNVNDEDAAATQKIATEYIDDILEALKEDDYKRFSKNLTPEFRQELTKENFKLMAQSFREKKGSLMEKNFLTTLDKGVFKVYLWKAVFKTKDQKGNAAGKDKFRDDTLIKLVLGKVDDKYIVFAFSIQ